MRGERLCEVVEGRRDDREAGGRAVAAQRRRGPAQAASAPWRSKAGWSGPSPSNSLGARDRMTGRLKRSTSREATIPITPSCQSSSQIT